MKIAMVLYHYFPWGGLQRDFARIAREAVARGHEVDALVSDWQGDSLDGVTVRIVPVSGRSNHGRMASFASTVTSMVGDYQRVLGFNRLPGLDVYFAADTCFAAHVASKSALVRCLPRYATYLKLEQRVMEKGGAHLLFLNDDQCGEYLAHYSLPASRYQVLPPGIEPDRRRPENHAELRTLIRDELGVTDNDSLILFLGSGFKVKGLDRALEAFSCLPENAVMMIVGNDDAVPYLRGLDPAVRQRVVVLGPRHDVPALMQGADLLLHPAYRESAGMVLIEAVVAGLPVLTTDTCGYARYVKEAGAGEVMTSPFRQEALNRALQEMVESVPGPWQAAGLKYAASPELYRLAQNVVDALEVSR
ncbi:glucosyl transferase [Alcanivorax sp. 97CO-5]|jgi:UDP-glucose:(heptosyl)LPS alpha-1,3-glucosyltransferase|uniref:glycosyltransferase family 4 protein n=1 Tax=Alcanivorax TaxID=59753 RepID=UPI0003E7E318|nr:MULTISPECIES: glycosyltransferase family 4 protein [unclassified Alcanivorax]EUC67851.1 glucosyl transferase [Alcanivorax sp. 97CO-5]PKG00287.1 glucosyl transferase [Alcanivorax sp. 97CO-6]